MLMENKIKIFESEEFGRIRTLKEESGKVVFCGSDIAKALGYRNVSDALVRHCKGIVKHDTLTNGGVQAISYITEGDVYRLVAHSRLPGAAKFESWIFDEVLPTIRHTGGYVANEDIPFIRFTSSTHMMRSFCKVSSSISLIAATICVSAPTSTASLKRARDNFCSLPLTIPSVITASCGAINSVAVCS